MKIAFAGAAGQGKTTTAEGLLSSPEFMHFDFIKSNIHKTQRAGYPIGDKSNRLSQLLMLADKVGAELSYTGHSFVTDRTPIDLYAHMNVLNTDWDDYYYNTYQRVVTAAMQSYTHVFYFPYMLKTPDQKVQKKIDREIQALLRDFNVPHTYMPKGTVSERVDFIRFKLWKERYQ